MTMDSSACDFCRQVVPSGALKCASCGSWAVPLSKRPHFKYIVGAIAATIFVLLMVVSRQNAEEEERQRQQVCREAGIPASDCTYDPGIEFQPR